MNKGFLRGELLIKVCIFPHSPSPAHLQIPAEYLVGTSCYVNRTHCCAPQWSKHWCWGICQPFELEDNDSSFTRIHRRRGTSIQRLQSFFIITSHVFADTLCSIYRANVSLGAQKQLTRVLLGFCLYPINPGRFSSQYRTGANRCTPTLPRWALE